MGLYDHVRVQSVRDEEFQKLFEGNQEDNQTKDMECRLDVYAIINDRLFVRKWADPDELWEDMSTDQRHFLPCRYTGSIDIFRSYEKEGVRKAVEWRAFFENGDFLYAEEIWAD